MKKALIIGINYTNTESELRGCANDCETSKNLIIKNFGYKSENIVFLTDANGYTNEKPTCENIRKYIKWLVKDIKAGDKLFFHYSGHGTHLKDKNGDEKDGEDEAICPCDYEKNGFILDDEIYETLLKPIPKGVQLFSLMDCCHSGTIFDLKYTFAPESTKDKLIETGKLNCDGDILMISGCKDNQTSADAYIDKKFAGAMTTSFNKCLKRWFKIHKKNPSPLKIIKLMNDYMKENKYDQIPQINCSNIINLKENIEI